jgi:hypothetical protein
LETSKTQTEASADSKAFVTLRFVGDDLDADEISALLPVKPTRAHRKREEFFAGPSAGNLRGRTGIWFSPPTNSYPATTYRTIWLSMAMRVISVMDSLQFGFRRPNFGTRCRGAVHPNGGAWRSPPSSPFDGFR